MFYSIGINKYNIDLKFTSIHAEVDAINNLKTNHKHKSKKVIVIVGRVCKDNRLVMAKPCDNCIRYITNGLAKKNYSLRVLLYSVNNTLVKYTKKTT